jgi:hypothetical protein
MAKAISFSPESRRSRSLGAALLRPLTALLDGLHLRPHAPRAPIEHWPDYLLKDVGLERPAEYHRHIGPDYR